MEVKARAFGGAIVERPSRLRMAACSRLERMGKLEDAVLELQGTGAGRTRCRL